MGTLEQRNVVGVFDDGRSARAAVRFLEHAGFGPDVISVISGNIRQAREMSGSRSIPGAAVGTGLAVLLFAALLVVGPPEMRSDPVALVLGLVVLVTAGVGIGALAGRSRIFVADHAERYEDAVEEGETLVAVHVDEEQHDRARRLLREAGAVNVREEETIERA
ncbi:MAG: hypothetical protein ACRDGT_07140 [Candidatus Limnocylindria bacterium]